MNLFVRFWPYLIQYSLDPNESYATNDISVSWAVFAQLTHVPNTDHAMGNIYVLHVALRPNHKGKEKGKGRILL